MEDRPSPARTSACAFLRGDFPLVALNNRVERVLDDLGCGAEKPGGRGGVLPRDFARQMRRREPAYLGRGWGGCVGVGSQRKTRAHLARTPGPRRPRGLWVSRVRDTLGGPGATCSARAVRAEARAQSPPGGDCAPARCDLPAPTPSLGLWPPGGGSGRHRCPRWSVRGQPCRQVPGAALWTAPRAARRLCWRPAQPYGVEKVTGRQGDDRHGAACWPCQSC